jgi:dynein heavy chain
MYEFYREKRTNWVKNWPGQIVLAVDQIDWTKNVEQAIGEEGGLQKYVQVLYDLQEEIVQLVRGDLAPGIRITLKAMVVIDVHARDVVERLVAAKIQTTNDF